MGVAELIAVSATRGGSNPLFADFTSSMAEGSGWLLSVLMLTWLNALNPGITKINPSTIKNLKNVFIGMPLKLFMINTDFLNRHSLKRKYNNLRSRCQKDANLKTPAKIIQIERIRYVTGNISSI